MIALLTTVVLVPAATSSSQPLVTLGTITVADWTAAVWGTLGSQATGSRVTVNGQPLAVNSGGTFAGTANLNGAETIDLGISQPATAVSTHYQIPVQGQTVIPGSVIDSLTQAGLSVLQPTVTPGQPVTSAAPLQTAVGSRGSASTAWTPSARLSTAARSPSSSPATQDRSR